MTRPDPARTPATALALSRAVARVSPRRLAPAAASGAVSAACGIGLLATSGWLITRASTRPPVFVLSIAIGLVQAFALGRGIARYLQRLAVHDLSLEVLGRLRLHLYDVLEPLVPGGLPPGGPGQVLSGFVADADAVAEGFARKVTAAIDVTSSIVLGAVVAGLAEPGVGGVLVAGAGAVVAVAVLSARHGRDAAGREASARAELAGAVVETMRCAPELVAFGREDLVRDRLADVQRRSTAVAARRAVGAGLGRAAVTWVAGAALVAVVATGLAAHGAHELSGVMLAVTVFVALAVLDQCAALSPALADGGDGAARRLADLARLPRPVSEPGRDLSDEVADAGAVLGGVDVWAGATPVLEDVSLHVEPGRRTALVGRSGSGKTTVLHTLLHFVERRRGVVGVGGVDVRDMSRAGMARHVGWMAEQTHVFADTLAANLRLARPDADDVRCVDVLERVGLGPWFRSLPDGLDTVVGAGGRPVSAGERQRLGLARALLAGGSVLLLDEPTAHLDPASARGVLADLLDAAAPRTVLVVSHEDDVGPLVDTVVELESGRVVRTGRDGGAPRAPLLAPVDPAG
jgi:thiol reductant ABC exporter CydC subunit